MKRLVLLDSNSLINRAFYALPPLTTADGRPSNAVFGYTTMLMKIIKDLEPSHIVATFDLPAPTFRKELYTEYKATRKPMPEDLAMQMPMLKELLRSMQINIVELAGFEADDVIGTLAKKCDYETVIVTGDRDSLQLVSDSTRVWLTKRGITEIIEYTPEKLKEEGLLPSQIIDLKSLMGDSSDNIPGIPGVGEKTARSLLERYNSLEGVYEHTSELRGKLKDKIEENKELAYLSYKLATIDTDAPIEYEEEKSILKLPFSTKVRDVMTDFGFLSLVNKLEFCDSKDDSIIETVKVAERFKIKVNDMKKLEKLIQILSVSDGFAFVYDGNIHIGLDKSEEYEINLQSNVFETGLDYGEVMEALKSVLENKDINKYVYDLKTLWHQLGGKLILGGIDISVKGYLADANLNYKNLEAMITANGMDKEYPALSLMLLNERYDAVLAKFELTSLYEDLEMPLIEVLYDMEKEGFRLDVQLMNELGAKYTGELTQLTEQIYTLAGEKFNINSPSQLGRILFEVLRLKTGKKTKKGYSTNVEVLMSLRNDHPIVDMVLRYREISKLLNTYIDGFRPLLIDGRIHTVFKQTVTATGRLSSTEPNLQNIPVRKSEGRELRKMFVASEGCKLLCADYSQIEMRLLAHMSGDEVLIDAFNNNDDIHAITAAKAYNVPLEMVTSEMRRSAKAVNFGIIYGISSFGLANDIGTSPARAKEFIDKYFATYPKVKGYLDSNIAYAKEHGYVTSMSGRVRFIPELKSANYVTRNFGERIAMNMPLQGSASDIIKSAMIRINRELSEGGYKAKLVLQVHDELIIDCPMEEIEKVKEILGRCMSDAVKLKVSLKADVSEGYNWFEAK